MSKAPVCEQVPRTASPLPLVEALLSAHAQFAYGVVCWGAAAYADVCGLCLWWLQGPRIACSGLECELTHYCMHTHAHKGKEREEPAPINTLILPEYALSSLLPFLFSFTAYVCIYTSVCIQGVSPSPKGQ